jgi:hypothetical protein
MHDTFNKLRSGEDAQIDAAKKSKAAKELIADYSSAPNLVTNKKGVNINYCKQPSKEADVTHILSAMFQSGKYAKEFGVLHKFGQFVDGTTDAIFEDSKGNAILIEVEYKLANLYKHKHPLDTFEGVIVWTLGGMNNGYTKNVPWGKGGGSVPLLLLGAKGKWRLKWGTHQKKLWVLEDFI